MAFHEKQLRTSFNTTWIPIRIAVAEQCVLPINVVPAHLVQQKDFLLIIAFLIEKQLWCLDIYTFKPKLFDTECFLFRNS